MVDVVVEEVQMLAIGTKVTEHMDKGMTVAMVADFMAQEAVEEVLVVQEAQEPMVLA
jgi:hypothetical protein